MIPGVIELVATVGGLVAAPAFDFLKKKFIKSENDTPERTIGSLATTSPESVPAYVEALAKLKKANVEFFNRDVIGQASQWVVDLRASIRPIVVVAGLLLFILDALNRAKVIESGIELDTNTRVFFEVNISSWFGSRFTSK